MAGGSEFGALSHSDMNAGGVTAARERGVTAPVAELSSNPIRLAQTNHRASLPAGNRVFSRKLPDVVFLERVASKSDMFVDHPG